MKPNANLHMIQNISIDGDSNSKKAYLIKQIFYILDYV